MKGRRLGRWAYGLAALLALALAGDGGRAATVPAVIYGQDPLEVLSLKVRPNVIVVLDSSGSMTNNAAESTNTRSGDHPRSKMYQAKAVLRQIVQANQDKVSFQLGTYTQNSISFSNGGADTTGNRFQYVTDATAASGLLALGAVGDSFGRGLQSWQIIQTEWNRLYFGESSGAVCYATVPGTPRFYNQGSLLAADLQAAMNAATCTTGSRENNYTVTYSTANGTFTFARTSGSPRTFQIRWADAGSNIAGALGRRGASNTSFTSSTSPTRSSGTPYRLLHRAATGGSGGGLGTQYSFTEDGTTYYQLSAGRLWNGEVVRVQANGTICGMTFPTAAERTNPPTLTLQLVADTCGADTAGSTATFTFAGAAFGWSGGCRGFRSKSDLVPCDLQSPPAPTQFTLISPYIDLEFPFQADGQPADLTTNGAAYGSAGYSVPDGVPDYVEAQDGSFATQSIDVAPSAKAGGYTPIANSLIDIKGAPDTSNSCVTNDPPDPGQLDSVTEPATIGACTERGFQKLWSQGQAGTTSMAGPAPWQLDPISTHLDPKEKTIVLFVTDGDDTCPNRSDTGATSATGADARARRAASYAEALYTPIVATEPASSVQTYVIGFGGAFTAGEPYRLDWIAWGGSGLGQGTATQPDVNWTTDSSTTLADRRAQCSTCEDAFIAPDAATLAEQLQGLIDQGASSGDFTAQQSITESLFEYVDRASDADTTYDARSPSTRYRAITPTRIISSFTLPGFKGQVKAYQNDGADNAVLRWSAGDKLNEIVRAGFTAANCPAANGGLAGECMFRQLHGGVGTDPSSSSAVIKRRIYSTERNGLYDFTATSLMDGTANQRIALWPPSNSAIVPADYSTPGSLDLALGLPADTAADPAAELAKLQDEFKACLGSNLPTLCGTTQTALTRMKAARREARELILAFAAGARPVLATTGLKRSGTSGSAADRNQILYTYRSWVLADSELATAAVVTPPLPAVPEATPYLAEYTLFRDGAYGGATAAAQIPKGFGLRDPDKDGTTPSGQNDTRTALKPVMTVVYVPANDMLHAFRAGPSVSPSTLCDAYATTLHPTPTTDCGGEELWGFVPYDQLGALNLLAANQPQGRDNHVYMLARGIRFSDVFVPEALTNVDVGGVTQAEMKGVWRRVLYFGRGIGGKSLTALDVTAPGAYTASRLQTQGPIPLWSRGNPDTETGIGTGAANGSAGDLAAYATMGQTWSIPVVAYVGGQTFYADKRATGRGGCSPSTGSTCPVDHVLFVGSGYSEVVGEGTTFYTLDALTGDVIASVDVEAAASTAGLNRSPKPTDQEGVEYENALVANPAGFNPKVFSPLTTVHPAAAQVTRVYFGDLYGRLWKVLTAQPNVVVPVADLGADQPIGTAASLLGLPTQPDTPIPYIFLTSGADRRQSGPFRMFGFWDQGDDVTTTTSGTSTTCVDAAAPCETGVTSFLPVEMVFNRFYDQGDPEASCGYTTEEVFRGTAQPAAAFECGSIEADPASGAQQCQDILGRVFFAGTRLSLPNTKFAPPTPLACGQGDYPCRSQFDSILYALGAKTGNAAYDLNASGDDAYRIFRDSRLVAVQMQADPDPSRGGSSLAADEGLVKAAPKPPPPPGVPPTANTSTANVVMTREPGQPPPAVRYGSTVCQ